MRELTSAECKHLSSKATCPECKVWFLFVGPRKSLHLDLRCDNPECHKEFHIVLREGNVASGRLLKRDEPGLYSRQLFSRSLWR
jgi:hypothetical protein